MELSSFVINDYYAEVVFIFSTNVIQVLLFYPPFIFFPRFKFVLVLL